MKKVHAANATNAARAPDLRASLRLRSEDAKLSFVLLPRRDGLFVERTRRVTRRSTVVQSSLFIDRDSFARWCEVDPTRFADPLLWHQVKKCGIAAFDATPAPAGGVDA